MRKWLVAFCFCASSAFGLNGMLSHLVPSESLQEMAVESTGALMLEEAMEAGLDSDGKPVSKSVTRSIGNVVYIGNSRRGSVLLVHSYRVTKANGEPDYEFLRNLTVRFGPSVTDLKIGKVAGPTSVLLPVGQTQIHVFNKDRKSTDALAAIELPYVLEEPLRPATLIGKGAPIPFHAPYFTFGFGYVQEQAVDAKAVLTPYDKALTTGHFMATALKLNATFAEASLFKLDLITPTEWKKMFSTDMPGEDSFVNGPCENDSAAPLFMEASRVVPAPQAKTVATSGLIAQNQAVLVGLNYAVENTCVKPVPGKSAVLAYLDLSRPDIQNWIAGLLK